MTDTNIAWRRYDRPHGIMKDTGQSRRNTPMSAAVAALLFLAATALPARAEDFANDPARAWPHTVRSEQRPVFGGTIARQPGTATGGLVQPRTRNEASNAANAPTQSDADDGSFVPPFATDPHMYDYLSSSAYRGGA